MEALMPGSAGGDVAPTPARPAHGDLDQGPDRRASPITSPMLPPDPRRPHRRPAPRGRGDRGPRHRLRHARQRDRRRLARPRLGRRLGRRRGAAVASSCATFPGALGAMAGHPRRQARQHRQPGRSSTATAASTTFHLDIEVHDLAHLHAIIAALRDADPVSSVERDLALPLRRSRALAAGEHRQASPGPTRSPSSARSAPACSRPEHDTARARFRRPARAATWTTGSPTGGPA